MIMDVQEFEFMLYAYFIYYAEVISPRFFLFQVISNEERICWKNESVLDY
jgi:hypothetical protein